MTKENKDNLARHFAHGWKNYRTIVRTTT